MERRTAVDTIYLENSGFRRIGRTSCYSFTDNQQTMPLNVNTTTIITKRQTLLRITSHSLPLWIDPPVFPPCRTTFLPAKIMYFHFPSTWPAILFVLHSTQPLVVRRAGACIVMHMYHVLPIANHEGIMVIAFTLLSSFDNPSSMLLEILFPD